MVSTAVVVPTQHTDHVRAKSQVRLTYLFLSRTQRDCAGPDRGRLNQFSVNTTTWNHKEKKKKNYFRRGSFQIASISCSAAPLLPSVAVRLLCGSLPASVLLPMASISTDLRHPLSENFPAPTIAALHCAPCPFGRRSTLALRGDCVRVFKLQAGEKRRGAVRVARSPDCGGKR